MTFGLPTPLFGGDVTLPQPSCRNCAHFDRFVAGRCAAYPNGIPIDILGGDTAHMNPIDGDNGIQWEPAEDAPLGVLENQQVLGRDWLIGYLRKESS